VYRHVIDDVINQVRGDFEEMGIDDNILNELQRVLCQDNHYKV
jgi:transcription initiation factor TFIIA large subunit